MGEKLEDKLTRVWYNPEINGYEFYDPSGREVLLGGLSATVTVADNWDKNKGAGYQTAHIELVVRIVNEKP